jgi:hypothetical protein
MVQAQNDSIGFPISEKKSPDLIIKLNPASLLLESINGNGELFFSPEVSLCFGITHTNLSVPESYSSAVNYYKGNWYNLDFRFYYLKKGKIGTYIAPFYSCYYYNLSSSAGTYNSFFSLQSNTIASTSGSIVGRGEGILYGIEILNNHFSLDLYMGPTYYEMQKTGNYNFGYPFTSFVWRAGLTIGIAIY